MRADVRHRVLRSGGVLIICLGLVHLAATPHIASLIRRSASSTAVSWLLPPMLLNHVLVSVLLMPLGYLAFYAAPHSVAGARWARVTVRVVALSVATLPIVLISIMGARYFYDAPLFLVGAALAVVAALALLVAAFGK